MDIYQVLHQLMEYGLPFALATIIKKEGSTPRDVGAKMIVTADRRIFGTIGGGCAETGIVDKALEVIKERKPTTVSLRLEDESKGGIGMLCGGQIDVLIEYIEPNPHLLIFGSGTIAMSLIKIGKILGFTTIMIDPFASVEKMSEADTILREDVESGLSKVKITPRTYIVIVTRHQYDEPALRGVLRSQAAYIGLLGSRARVSKVFQTLIQEGVDESILKRVHAPIGLDIGAETPEEIAVSIFAEIVKIRRGGTGRSLSHLITQDEKLPEPTSKVAIKDC